VTEQQEFKRARAKLEADLRIKTRRFAYGVYGIVTRDYDYAHTGQWTQGVNKTAWQLDGADSLEARVVALSSGDAFDLGRAVILLRAGVALGYLTDEQSWARVLPVLRAIQTQCQGWEDYLNVYLRGRRRWLNLPDDGSKDDADMREVRRNADHIRRLVWRTTPFRTTLE
jgi:hypothetical protein